MMNERLEFEVLRGPAASAQADRLRQHAFQSDAWVQAVAAARGRSHQFVAVRVMRGMHAGACLFGGVHRRMGIQVFESMPMAGYGGWCLDGTVDEDQEALLTQAWLARSPWWVVGLTGAPGRERAMPRIRSSTWITSCAFGRLDPKILGTHVLSLAGDDEALLMRARPKARNHLRRVQRSGYEIELGGPDAIPEFCRLFRAGSAEWKKGTQFLMPNEFFEQLCDSAIADIWRVKRDGRCIGAGLFLKGRTEIFYQASGTVREPAEVSATDAMLWTAMRHYRDLGYLTLNLGASDGLATVRFFKEKLGGVAASYRRTVFVFPRLVATVA